MKLIINDNRIWNPMEKAAELLFELQNNDAVTVHLNSESPAIEETELPKFFNFIARQGVDLSKITIITGNPLETYNQVNVTFDPAAMFELPLFQKIAEQIPKTKNIKYHFGNLVSRTTLPRLILASHLYKNYKDKTFQTFHYDHTSDYHKTHLEFDKLIHEYGANSVECNEALHLLSNAPLLKEKIQSYPIMHPENVLVPCNWYSEFAIDIICETWYQGTNFFVTEKFWRAVATKTPFIIHGAQHIITNLHKLGFKTFHEFWDEGYQEDPSYYNIKGIKDTLKHIANQPLEEIKWMYYNMQEILDHNYEMLKSIDSKDIEKKLNG